MGKIKVSDDRCKNVKLKINFIYMDSGGTKARFKPSHYIVSTHTNVTVVYIPCA